jgi:LemA protein
MNKPWVGFAIVGVIILFLAIWIAGTYNSLVALDQAVQSQWGTVESVYQRRADLIPNLVATVKGVANFEKSTYVDVANARAKVGQVTISAAPNALSNPQAFSQFEQAQAGLSSALSRLLAVAENYPDLKANQNFLDLQAQLEGTENRIAVERRRYNEVAQSFNTTRLSFPTAIVAGLFGDRFKEKPYFKAQEGSQNAPKVTF